MKTHKRVPGEPVAFPKDFLGIEEVENPTFEDEVVEGGEVLAGEVAEVLIPSEEDQEVIDGGEISMRNRIALTVISVWIAWIVVGLITFIMTGNPVLILSSSALMSVPLYRVLGYYF